MKCHLAKLELEVALLVKDLDAMVVGVCHHDLIIGGNCHTTWLGELPSQDAKLTKLAVVDHLLPLDVCLGGIDYGRRWNGRSNPRKIVRGAGGEALQGQVAHAQQVEGTCHVVVLQVVQVVKAQCLVKTSPLNLNKNLFYFLVNIRHMQGKNKSCASISCICTAE